MSRKKKQSIPRYVLSLTDTKNTLQSPDGQEQYYAVNVAFESKQQLFEPIAEEDGGMELMRVINHFFETSEAMDGKLK